jgi:hypothetical protein
MTEAYNDALKGQLEQNIWTTLKNEAKSMNKLDYASLTADIVGIFDPTPASDTIGALLSVAKGDFWGAGLSIVGMIPYVGDLGKLGKIAKLAPRTAKALEAMLKYSDNLANLGRKGLEKVFSLKQIMEARAKATKRVQQAMLDARNKKPNCKDCKKLTDKGKKRQLQMPSKGGKWNTPDGKPPTSGSGKFTFDSPKTLPDGRKVKSIDFVDGEPNLAPYAHKNEKHNLWEVTGDVGKDETALRAQMKATNPGWKPPNTADTIDGYVLHHASDGSVMYVPRAIHDKGKGGVAHTGGNSITNNDLF